MSDTVLERLKVVVEAEDKSLNSTMKKIRKDVDGVNKAVGEQNRKMQKQMSDIAAPFIKSTEPMRKMQEELRKIVGATNTIAASHKNIQSQIEATEKKLRKLLLAKYDLMDDGKASEYTDSFKALQKEIETAEKSLRKLQERSEKMESAGGDMEYTKEYREAIKLLEQEESKLRQLEARRERVQEIGGNGRRNALRGLDYDILEKTNSVKALKSDIANMTNGEKFQNTQQWTALQTEIEKTQLKLRELKTTMERMDDTAKFQDTAAWTKLQREIERTRMELAQLNAEKYDMERTTKVRRVSKLFGDFGRKLKGPVVQGIRKTGGAFASLIHKFHAGIPCIHKTGKAFGGMRNNMKGLGGLFRTIGMTARFMFASMAIYGVINGAKEGFKNLAQYSAETNKSISILLTDLATLKNAFATAFAPILNVVTPILDTFITYLIDGANAVGQFFAALTGSTTWTKAIKEQQDYAGSLNGTADAAAKAKRELYGFDEITKQADDSSAGVGGAGSGIGNIFTTEEVSNKFSDFAQKIKDAWKNADFTEIGNIVGTQLKNGLDGINWEGIKEKCFNIAKSIATFINGFIGTEGLAESIGSTIGNALNTGIGTAYTYLTTADFKGMGQFIGDMISSFFRTFDFEMAADTLNAWIDGLIDFIAGLLNGITWSDVFEGVTDFLGNLELDTVTVIIGAFAWKYGLGALTLSTLNSLLSTKVASLGTIQCSATATVAIGLMAWEIGWTVGKEIGKVLYGEAAYEQVTFANILDAILYLFSDSDILLTAIVDFFKWIGNGFKDLGTLIDYAIEDLCTWLGDGFEALGTLIDYAIEDLVDAIKDFFTGIKDWFADWGNTWFENSGLAGDESTGGAAGGNKNKDTLSAGIFGDLYSNAPLKTLTNDIKNQFKKENFNIDVGVETTPAEEIQAVMQEDFTAAGDLQATVKATSGSAVFGVVQSEFGRNTFHTNTKSDTSGTKVFNAVQSAFSKTYLHTGAKSDTSGDKIRQNVQSGFGLRNLLTGVATTVSGAELRNIIQNSFGAQPLQVGVSLTLAKNAVDSVISALKSFGFSLNHKADGGIYTDGSWHPVTAYAGGGLPPHGQFFMAREAGPELVGTIGGHTAVMNNNQIVSSVASGVYSAVLSAMSQTMNGRSDSTPTAVYVYVGGEQVTDYVVKDINGRTISAGKCPILT